MHLVKFSYVSLLACHVLGIVGSQIEIKRIFNFFVLSQIFDVFDLELIV
jgi:hypothetical protein